MTTTRHPLIEEIAERIPLVIVPNGVHRDFYGTYVPALDESATLIRVILKYRVMHGFRAPTTGERTAALTVIRERFDARYPEAV